MTIRTEDAKKMVDEILRNEDGNLPPGELQRIEAFDHVLNVQQRCLSSRQEQELEQIWQKEFK